jgi:hypothetical protein
VQQTASKTTELARQLSVALPPATSCPSPTSLGDCTDRDKELAGIGQQIHAAIARFHGADWDWAWWSGRCRDAGLYSPDDAGLTQLLARFSEAYLAWQSQASQAEDDPTTAPGAGTVAKANERQEGTESEQRLEMNYPLEEVAHARERAEALLGHLNQHSDYYRYVLFQALPPAEQLDVLVRNAGINLPAGMFEPQVVSMRGEYLAVPLHVAVSPTLSKFRNDLIAGLSTLNPASRNVTMPTPGLVVHTRLGDCSGCEKFIEDSRTIELRRLDAQAQLVELEGDRYKARLAATPAQLDDPQEERSPLEVRVVTPPAAPPPTP